MGPAAFVRSLALLLPLTALASHSPSPSSLRWGNCTADDPPNLSCSELSVPIDWDNPRTGNITIAIARLAATEKKTGTMFFNPGGPGEPVVDLFFELAEGAGGNRTMFPPQFDIIGPDPRGIGYSHPLKCDPVLWDESVNYHPLNEADFHKMISHNRVVGDSCRKLTGPVFDHLDTLSVARDFDAIRAALGEERLTYLGLSYGTVIGQAYAELFPDKIRAFALDGIVDHALVPNTDTALRTYSFDNVLEIFIEWCATTPNNTLYHKNVTQLWTTLIADAPIPAPSCKKSGQCKPTVDLYDLVTNFHNALFFKDPPTDSGLPTWWDAAQSLKQAADGDASLISNSVATNSSSSVFYESGSQVLCLDRARGAGNFAAFKSSTMMSLDVAPLVAGITGLGAMRPACIGWPSPVQYPANPTRITGVPPFLLTNAYHDPSTPYTEAVSLAARIEGSVLATRNGVGHTSYFLLGETYSAINEYLVTLKTPAPDTIFET